MKKCTASCSYSPEVSAKNPLTELLRNGGRDIIVKAIEPELETLLGEYSSHRLEDEQSGGIGFFHHTAQDGEDPALRGGGNDAWDGLQTASVSRKEVEKTQGL